jgi:anti-sigma factor RsiW
MKMNRNEGINRDACARIVRLLPALLDGGISAGEIREVESHLALCPSCAAERETIARTLRIVDGRSRLEPDPAFFDAMRRNVRGKLVTAPAPRRLPRAVWQGGLAAAAALVFMLALQPWALRQPDLLVQLESAGRKSLQQLGESPEAFLDEANARKALPDMVDELDEPELEVLIAALVSMKG